MNQDVASEALLPMSYAAILGAIAAEVAHTRELVGRVEAAVCQIADTTPIGSHLVEDLQQIDLALQQLAALHSFAMDVSADADPVGGLQIGHHLQRITLHDVRSRISGELAEASAPQGGWEEF